MQEDLQYRDYNVLATSYSRRWALPSFRCLRKSLPHKNSAVYVENGSIVKSHTWVDDFDSELIHGVYSLLLWSI